MEPSALFPPPGAVPSSPGHLAATVARLLARHGLTRVYTAACQVLALISVAAGLTVWTNGRRLWWDEHGLVVGAGRVQSVVAEACEV